MLVLVLILSVTIFIIFTVLHRTLFPYLRQVQMRKRLAKEGIDADAVLLNMQQTGFYINNLPEVKLQVQVFGRRGRHFVAESNEVISIPDLNRLYIGRSLQVKYNPENTKEVMVVWTGINLLYPF
jgi:hypothetical protein